MDYDADHPVATVRRVPRRVRLHLLALLSVVVVTGCSEGPGAPRASASSTPAASAASSTEAPPVCIGVPDCHVDGVGDIDGNGQEEQIAVVGHPTHGELYINWPEDATPTIRVLLPTGAIEYKVSLGGWVLGHITLGSAAVDGVPGEEILISHADGAHGQTHTMLTLRDGRLVPLLSPDPYLGDDATGPVGSWGADGSIRSSVGWHCVREGVVEEYGAEGLDTKDGKGIEYTLDRRAWRWTNRGWREIGQAVTSAHHQDPPGSERYRDYTNCGTMTRARPYPLP